MGDAALAADEGRSEAELVAAAKQRDEAAIRTIVRLYNQTLFRLARGILPDAEAEDAVQEAYLRAFRGLAEFRGEASLKTWLGRIVVNTAREHRRRHRPSLALNGLESVAALDPERRMAQDQIRRLLEQAIDELPPPFRAVVMARLLEEMSVEETAAVLDLKPETVKTRLHRARRLLRAAVEKRLGAVIGEAFPFGDARCRRMADRVGAALAALLLGTGIAAAQTAKPSDPQIAHIAYTAGEIDIKAANQALQKSKNPQVRAFAQDMVRDHTAVNQQALALVKKLNVTPQDNPTSQSLVKQADEERAKLAKLNGAAFDRAYVENEVNYHHTVNNALATTLIPDAQNAELKSLLETGLKIFQGHEQHARQVAAALK